MKPQNYLFIFLFLAAVSFVPSTAYALRVKAIHPENGSLSLDDSRQVQFAGIRLTPEAFKSLAILFSAQDVEVDLDKALSKNHPIPFAYVSVKTLEISLPFKDSLQPRGSKILLNEMLLSAGLAVVDETGDFKKKESYLKLQEEARRLGKGVWSQELSLKKES